MNMTVLIEIYDDSIIKVTRLRRRYFNSNFYIVMLLLGLLYINYSNNAKMDPETETHLKRKYVYFLRITNYKT